MNLRRLMVGIGLMTVACLGAKEYKVGYIDSEAIISRYEAAKEARKELDAELEKLRAKADSLRDEYEKSQEEYESQELTLSEDGKRAKLAEVSQRKQRYDAYIDQVYREGGKIDQKNEELIAPIVEEINTVVSKIASDAGFSLVLDASKSEIVYAEFGLDLTEEVVTELNRQFAPVAPVVARKKVCAVMAIFEGNDEATEDRIGRQVRTICYDLIRSQLEIQVEMVANQKVDEVATGRGYSGRQIGQTEALDVARAVNADYAIYGECTKRDRRISFSLTIVDVQLGVTKTEAGEASRVEDLRERLGEAVQVLLSSVKTP